MDIKFPIEENDISGFSRVDTARSAKQKLKNIILTNPGERVMIPNFGVGLKQYLFSNIQNGNIQNSEDIRQRIISQVSRYSPDIRINSVEIVENYENSIKVSVFYSVSNFFNDTLEIVL